MSDGSIHIDTKIDNSQLKPQMAAMKKTVGQTFASMSDFMMGPVGAAKTIVGAFVQVGKALDSVMTKAQEGESASAILTATLRATGAEAWTSTGKLNAYADAMAELTLFEDDAISSMQGVLLGFKNIQGDNFEEASDQILNMATVMKMDLTSAAQAVGKALDAPITGMDSLSRQGFKFSQASKTVIKSFVDTGQMAKAQEVILKELASTYGGAAQSVAQNATGIYSNMKKSYGDMLDAFGSYTAFAMKDINAKLMKGFRTAAENIKQQTKIMQVEFIITPLIQKKGVKADDVEKQLKAYGMSWADAADVLEKQINSLNSEYAKIDPNYMNKEGYKEIIKPYKEMQKRALYQAALEQKIAEDRAAEMAAEEAETKRLADLEEKRLAKEEKDKEAAAQLDEDRVKWLENVNEERAEADRKAWDDRAEALSAEAEAERQAAEQIEADRIAVAEAIAEANERYAAESAQAWADSMSYGASIMTELSAGIDKIMGDDADSLSGGLSALSSVFTAAASNFTNVQADIQAVVAVISVAAEAAPATFASIQESFMGIAGTLISALAPVFEVILGAVATMLPVLQPIFDLLAAAAALVTPLIPLIGAFVQVYSIVTGLTFILPLLAAAIEIIAAAVTWLYNKVVVPVYNWLITGFNKIYNGFADFINGILKMIDDIPLVELTYRVARRDENAGTLGEVGTAAAPGSAESAAALVKANKALKENRDLFTLAARAGDAYNAVLTGLTDTISSFYNGLKSIGSDISGMIIDSLANGFDNDDFLFTLEEYIVSSVVQAAVFTDSFLSQVASIGTALATAIATGNTSAIASLQGQLAQIYASAAATAQAATDAVAGAFGSYAVGSLGLPSDGPIYAHAGEGVIPAGLMSEAMSAGLTIAPTSSLLAGLGNITVNLQALLEVDGLQMARAAFRYQDEVTGAAYGS